MLTETSLNSLVVSNGLRPQACMYGGSHSMAVENRWRDQASSIAYRISSEYLKTDRHHIQREAVTLISKADSKDCCKFVLAYHEKGIDHFINSVYEISRKSHHNEPVIRKTKVHKGSK